MSASTSTSTSALPTLRQALCQLSSPSSLPTSQLSVHWDLNLGPARSVCTAGPQAQCAPLDLNQGPSQLSVHRWTSTWDLPSPVCTAGPHLGFAQRSVHRWTSTGDLPSSVCTAGPQRADRMPEDMPDRMSDGMPEDMPDRMPEDIPECQKICQIE